MKKRVEKLLNRVNEGEAARWEEGEILMRRICVENAIKTRNFCGRCCMREEVRYADTRSGKKVDQRRT